MQCGGVQNFGTPFFCFLNPLPHLYYVKEVFDLSFAYKLIDYKIYTYNEKQYIKLFVYCRHAEHNLKINKLYSHELEQFVNSAIDTDISDNLTFSVRRDGTTNLDIDLSSI